MMMMMTTIVTMAMLLFVITATKFNSIFNYGIQFRYKLYSKSIVGTFGSREY